jgi:hypothetical protein
MRCLCRNATNIGALVLSDGKFSGSATVLSVCRSTGRVSAPPAHWWGRVVLKRLRFQGECLPFTATMGTTLGALSGAIENHVFACCGVASSL